MVLFFFSPPYLQNLMYRETGLEVSLKVILVQLSSRKTIPEDNKAIKYHEKLIKCRLFWKTEVQGHWTPHCNLKSLAQLKLWDFIESGIAAYQMNHSCKGDHGSCGLALYL